jgi:hypothetical protein
LNENILKTTDTCDHISHAEHGQCVEKFENLPVFYVVVTVFTPKYFRVFAQFFFQKTCKGENVLGTTDTGYPVLDVGQGQRVEKFENLPACYIVVTDFSPKIFPGFCPIFFQKTCKGKNVLGTTDTGYPILDVGQGQCVEKFENLLACYVVVTVFFNISGF